MNIKRENIQPLFTEEQLQQRIKELADQITEDYKDKNLVVIGVLRGAFLFLADLCRQIPLDMKVDFLGLSSYGDRTSSSGVVRLTSDLSISIVDQDVLIIEDIIDTGLTMDYLYKNLATRRPRSLKCCALLDKPDRRIQDVHIDYIGFTIPDRFVIGYGLDYQNKFRNLPYIGIVEGIEDD